MFTIRQRWQYLRLNIILLYIYTYLPYVCLHVYMILCIKCIQMNKNRNETRKTAVQNSLKYVTLSFSKSCACGYYRFSAYTKRLTRVHLNIIEKHRHVLNLFGLLIYFILFSALLFAITRGHNIVIVIHCAIIRYFVVRTIADTRIIQVYSANSQYSRFPSTRAQTCAKNARIYGFQAQFVVPTWLHNIIYIFIHNIIHWTRIYYCNVGGKHSSRSAHNSTMRYFSTFFFTLKSKCCTSKPVWR